MRRLPLLTTQKNEVLRFIHQERLDPSEFTWEEITLEADVFSVEAPALASHLVHNPSGYWITFDMRGGPNFVSFSPARYTAEQRQFCKGDWVQMCQYTLNWIRYLKREIQAPDLWASIGEQQKQVESATAAGAPNTPFTQEEQQAIATRLDEIKGYIITTYHLEQRQLQLLEDHFEFLKEESKKQGRRSWVQMALGTVLTMYLAKFDPAAVQYVLRQIVDTFIPYVTKLLATGG